MRRWGLWIALMLSLGVNVGVLIMVVADRVAPRRLEEPGPAEPLLPAAQPEPTAALAPEPEPASPPPAESEPAPTGAEPQPAETEPGPERQAEPQPSSRPAPAEPPASPSRPAPPPEGAVGPGAPQVQDPAPTLPGRGPSAEALRRAEPRLDLLADRLRLRGRQRQRFLEAQRRFFTEVTARRVELATLRQELRRQLTAPAPDRQRIRRILERSGQATAELDAAFAENVLTVRRILGPRQRRAYFLFLERLRSGMDLPNRPGRR